MSSPDSQKRYNARGHFRISTYVLSLLVLWICSLKLRSAAVRIGKVVKSNSHCDYVVQVDDAQDVVAPPCPEDCGFGQFVCLDSEDRHWAVGLVYNSQLFNPLFLNNGPRLSSEPDPHVYPRSSAKKRALCSALCWWVPLRKRKKRSFWGPRHSACGSACKHASLCPWTSMRCMAFT